MNWVLLALIGLFTVLGIATIMYIIGKVFKLKRVLNWAKGEFLEIFATALIIIFIFGLSMALLALGRGMASSYAGGTLSEDILFDDQPSPYDLPAYAVSLMSKVAEMIRADYDYIARLGIILMGLKETTIEVGAQVNLYSAAVGASFFAAGGLAAAGAVGAGAYAIFNSTGFISTLKSAGGALASNPLLNNGFLSGFSVFSISILAILAVFALPGTLQYLSTTFANIIFFQYFSMELIKFGAYIAPILLPIGIVLRTYPGSRGVGALFISLSLGLLFILPLSYVLLIQVTGMHPTALSEDSLSNYEASELYKMYEKNCVGVSNLGVYKDTVFYLHQQGKLNLFLGIVQGRMKTYFLLAFIYPFAALVVTYTFIRSFGMLLGADLGEIAKGLMKFI